MPGTYPPGVQQIAHGTWSWTARHPEWHPGVFGARVVSFALPGNGRTVLIDPLAPHDDDGFWTVVLADPQGTEFCVLRPAEGDARLAEI